MASPSAEARAAFFRIGTEAERPGDAELWAQAWSAADPGFRKGYMDALAAISAAVFPDEPETRH